MTGRTIPGVQNLRPADVQQHLRARGWTADAQPRHGVLKFAFRDDQARTVRVSLVQDTSFDDFGPRMAELVEVLSVVEHRPIPDLVEELSAPPGDVLVFRTVSQLIASGTIPLDDSFRIRHAQRTLLLSAAHSVLEPLPHFRRMSRGPATDFLRACREGQTGRGSYLTRVLVPVPAPVGAHAVEAPFARRVTRKLVAALRASVGALANGRVEELLERAREGVSANLLYALAELQPPGETGRLEIDIQWARTLPETVAETFRFDAGQFEQLETVARTLTEISPSRGYELEGYVLALQRQENDPQAPGIATIAANLEDAAGQSAVHLSLAQADYQTALEAHQNARGVRVTGTLLKEGRSWKLQDAAGFRIVAPAEGD